jgi:hypothetical protein
MIFWGERIGQVPDNPADHPGVWPGFSREGLARVVAFVAGLPEIPSKNPITGLTTGSTGEF